MKKNKVRLAITGITGKMGTAILNIINQNNLNIILNGVIDIKNHIKTIKYGSTQLNIKSNIYDIIHDFDVLVDFTNPEASLQYVQICQKYKKKIVIGTTGFNHDEKKQIVKASNDISILWSANFSQGINIINKLLQNITQILCENFQSNVDIDIIEKHHKHKIDSPSGTALFMKNIILTKYHQYHMTKNINCHSIRAGDYSGEHQIIFSFAGEQIEFIHKTVNRIPFAKGVLQAAIWLSHVNKNGIYSMNDVLGL
ncbi:4-hydroxy-tetrahydrodipicolinate reductase [Enterobacteriaceae endosymbiont of Macroplea appendiculata]|uniref:4-hydroxy-tetrahydrodipicolinate reductase n=1 Tax=Enterobacteriaceae endosymbiont of Macroplea appendiculata TaxID=2675790 RepID=UPI001449A64A|nr:4-hydroxy-tetrahydrodipicolinate reductase [Enterobacteriaceae endosymbiont of Macroplea appendiculata]QJC30686.1 4-hydroxy-tetrahydrodipicolinate reductase [Enterobacteriaceae endosymbiont of Macroplea appendiculata]